MKFFKYCQVTLLFFSVNVLFSQDTTLNKISKIGVFASVNTGWEGVDLKYYPLGNEAQIAYGLCYERRFSKRFSLETGISHSVFWGGWYRQNWSAPQRELLHHIRMPIIAKYYFYSNEIEDVGIIFGYLPGFFLDKQSRIDRTGSSGFTKYYQRYIRYGGFDIITPVAGIEYLRKTNKQISLKTQLRGFIQNEVIVAGLLIGLNYSLK